MVVLPPKPTSTSSYGAEQLLELSDISFEAIQDIKDKETRGLVFANHNRGYFSFRKLGAEILIKEQDNITIDIKGFINKPIPFILNENGNVITPTTVKFEGSNIIISLPDITTGFIYLR